MISSHWEIWGLLLSMQLTHLLFSVITTMSYLSCLIILVIIRILLLSILTLISLGIPNCLLTFIRNLLIILTNFCSHRRRCLLLAYIMLLHDFFLLYKFYLIIYWYIFANSLIRKLLIIIQFYFITPGPLSNLNI